MHKVRYGIIGCGVIFKTHVRVLGQLEEHAELVAVCDIDPAALQAAVTQTGARGYSSAEELVADPDVDAVIVCTPSGYHGKYAILALNAGKHTISEKPMEVDLTVADQMIEASNRNGKLLAIISQTRYGRGFQNLHAWLDSGKFGRPIYGSVQMYYYRSQEYYDSAGWRGTWALDGGGALMNQGVHYADQLVWAMGRPKTVYARAGQLGHERVEVEDIVTATIEFQSGALGSLTATTCAFSDQPGVLDVIGSAGSARIKNGKLIFADFVDGIHFDETTDPASEGASIDPRVGGFAEHWEQVRDITHAILENREPQITMRDGRSALELVLAIYESARTGRIVTL